MPQMTETVTLEVPKELHQGKELRKIKFVSPIRSLILFVVPLEFDPRGLPKRTVYDTFMEREVPREVAFESGQFQTDSPYILRGMVNKKDGFELGSAIKGTYRVDTSCLPLPAQDAWPIANTEGRRAIMLDVLKRQESGEPMEAGFRYHLPDELMRPEEVARIKETMGDGGKATEALRKLKVCHCGRPKSIVAKQCRACHMEEYAEIRKEKLAQIDPAEVVLSGEEEATGT